MSNGKMISGVDFVAIPTRDATKAKEFYEDVLGIESSIQWGEMPAFELEPGDVTIALMQMEAFGQEFKPNGAPMAFHVDDFDAAKAALEERGVEFQTDVIDSGVCKQIFFADPDGNPVGIHHRYEPREG
jgi:catechol 2,3-dioxygenase-like lactoylglutathione lyase family enzyme